MIQIIKKHNHTYGEAHVLEQRSKKMQDGEWKKTILIKKKPHPMPREESTRYYNSKLFEYWNKTIKFKNIKSEQKKKRAIAYLMFGSFDKDRLKLEDEIVKDILNKEKK